MAYGDSQYGNFQFQFDPSFLSNIISMAQARKQKQQQQQQQMVQSGLALTNAAKQQGWLNPSVNPDGMGANAAVRASAAQAAPSDAERLRIMAYGPSQGEYTHDTMYGPLGALRQGDVAVSPNLKSRFPLGSRIVVRGQPYRVADWSYYHPGEPTSNTVEIWNGEDLGYQPVQRFARGGVVSWSDPYGNEPLAAQQYVRSVPLADVSGMANIIARQNEQKQQMYQQNMQNAFNAATKIMEQRRTDAIGQALLQNDPETAKDPLAAQLVASGARPMEAYQLRKQQIADEADAQRQATNDWWVNHERQAREYQRQGLGSYGEKLPPTVPSAPVTTTDPQGREWRLGEGNHWYPIPGQKAAKEQLPPDVKKVYGINEGEFLDSSNTQKGNLNNGTFTPDANGTHIRIKHGDEKYVTMTVPEFEQQKQAIMQRRTGSMPSFSGQAGDNTGTAPDVVRQDAGVPPLLSRPEAQDSGTVRVQSPQGQTGTIPAARLKAYLAAGWKQI